MKLTQIELEEITKNIKSQITSKNQDKKKKLTDYIIKNKICKAFGFENINHFNHDIKNKSILIMEDGEHLRELSKINKELVNAFLSYDVKLEMLDFMFDIHKKTIDQMIENTYNFTLSQYIEMYDIINLRNISNGKKIEKYEDCKQILKPFVKDIIERKRGASSLLLEEKIFKRRLEKEIRLTPCDKILKKIIDSDESENSINGLIFELDEELSRLQKTYELKIKDFIHQEGTDIINKFHFPDFKEKKECLSSTEDCVLGEGPELSWIHFNKNKKRKKMSLSEKEMINGTVFMAGRSEDVNLALLSILKNNVLNGDGFFYFDGTGDYMKMISVYNSIPSSLSFSKIIYLTHENFMNLSDEKIEEYIIDNRIVFFSLMSFDKSSGLDKMKALHRIEYISNKISKVKKKTGTTIVMTGMDKAINERDKNVFFEKFEENRREKYIPAKMKFIFSAQEYIIFNAEKYLDKIENILIFNQADPNIFYNHLVQKKGLNKYQKSDKVTFRIDVRDFKHLNRGEFFYLKNENGKIKIPILAMFKAPLIHYNGCDNLMIDSNE